VYSFASLRDIIFFHAKSQSRKVCRGKKNYNKFNLCIPLRLCVTFFFSQRRKAVVSFYNTDLIYFFLEMLFLNYNLHFIFLCVFARHFFSRKGAKFVWVIHFPHQSKNRDFKPGAGIIQESVLPNQRYRFFAIKEYTQLRIGAGTSQKINNNGNGKRKFLATSKAADDL